MNNAENKRKTVKKPRRQTTLKKGRKRERILKTRSDGKRK